MNYRYSAVQAQCFASAVPVLLLLLSLQIERAPRFSPNNVNVIPDIIHPHLCLLTFLTVELEQTDRYPHQPTIALFTLFHIISRPLCLLPVHLPISVYGISEAPS